MAASPLFLNTDAMFVGLSAMISHVKIGETCCRRVFKARLCISGQKARVGLAVVLWAHGHAEVCVDGIAGMGRAWACWHACATRCCGARRVRLPTAYMYLISRPLF